MNDWTREMSRENLEIIYSNTTDQQTAREALRECDRRDDAEPVELDPKSTALLDALVDDGLWTAWRIEQP